MSKKLVLLFLMCHMVVSITALAQEDDPFNSLCPPQSIVYTDLKQALQDNDRACRMELNQGLDSKLFPKLGKLKSLQALKLNNNGLSDLPVEFTDFSSLLYFSSKLNPLNHLPIGFSKLENLMYLELFDTNLDSIPQEIGYLNRLRSLQIQGNKAAVMRISDAIGHLPALQTLVIYNSVIDTIPRVINKLKKLEVLYLAKCGLKKIPRSLGELSNLRHLSLEGNALSTLPRELFKLKNLEYLSLKDNQFTVISDYISNLKGLHTLDLRGNSLTDYEIAQIKILLPGCSILK